MESVYYGHTILNTHQTQISGTKPVRPFRFVVLIPHRDAAAPLRALNRALFAAGFTGAFAFPAVAPAALVSRPFTGQDLRSLARTLRELSLRDGRDGTIRSGAMGSVSCPAASGLTFYGPLLDLPVPEPFPGEAPLRFPSLVLCAALIRPGEKPGINPGAASFSFRAAAVANMILRPLASGSYPSFEWKIGSPRWLPSPGRGAGRA